MPKDECAFGIRHDSYPPNAIRAFGVDLDRCQQACDVDLGEYQKGIHTVDFLIWIPDYQ